MPDNYQPTYCGQCGSPVQSGDRFCGSCGATVVPVTPEDPQVIPEPVAAQATPTRSNRTFLITGAVGILLVLLVGGGAIALVGSGNNLFGGSDPEPVPTQESVPPPETTQAPTEDSETTSDSPSSERDQYEEFAREYDEASRNEDWEATYSMLYETSMPGVTDSQDEFTEEEWIEIQEALREANGEPAPLEGVTVDQNEEATDSPARVTLRYEDGTQETITVIIPMLVNSGDEEGPQRFLIEEEVSELREYLTSGSTAPLGDDFAADAEEAAEDYYRAAELEDWEYTYDHLDSETQSMFTLEEWSQKNQYYWDRSTITYDILSVEIVPDSEELLTEVIVRVTGEEGSSFIRTTYWVSENGEWLHRFSQEEIDLFMPDLSYGEFVEAQQ
jgi:hypothetical protein